MRAIRASEIGAYLFCQRAWWYQRRGQAAENQVELAEGVAEHRRHGRVVFFAGCQRALAYTLFLAALVLLTIYFTTRLI